MKRCKLLLFVVSLLALLEGFTIIKLVNEKENYVYRTEFYGNSDKTEIFLTVTKDFYEFKNALGDFGFDDTDISLDSVNNGDVFIWGEVYFYSSTDSIDSTNARITVSADDEAYSINTILFPLEDKNNKDNSLSNKMFFYIDGSDKIKIDKIDKCTLNFSERHYEVEIEKFE